MLLRLTRVRKQLRNIESISNFKEKGAALFELFCLVYYVILISHFCACMWSYLAKMEMYYGYEHTWMHEYGIEHADWGRKYIFSIYWIAITSMTVGYGDIVPVLIFFISNSFYSKLILKRYLLHSSHLLFQDYSPMLLMLSETFSKR